MRLPHPLRAKPTANRDGDGRGVPAEPADVGETAGSRPRLRSDAFLKRAMDLWGDAVYRVALAQTGSPSDADDVYQDVFLRLLKDGTAFESDEHVKAWLLRVTVNRCHDLGRSSWNRRTTPLDAQHAQLEAPDGFRSDIWEVVGALPPDQRAAVHLYYVEGYSTEEIARIMECQPATVRTRLHRARERLKLDLRPPEAEPPPKPRPTPAPALHASPSPEQGKEPPHVRAHRVAEPRRLPHDDDRHACANAPAQ